MATRVLTPLRTGTSHVMYKVALSVDGGVCGWGGVLAKVDSFLFFVCLCSNVSETELVCFWSLGCINEK